MDWNNQDENTEKASGDGPVADLSSTMLMSSLYVYGAMIAIGGMICFHIHGNFRPIFDIGRFTSLSPMLGWGIIGCGIALIMIMSYFFSDLFEDFRMLKAAMVQMIGPLSSLAMVYLSFISALGEETLFRGAIQPSAGLLPTAIFFGLVHLGPTLRPSSWSVWAFFAGLLLGWVFEATGSIYSPLLIHFSINLITMFYMKTLYMKGISSSSEEIVPSEQGD